ncbi:MAG TPA: sugar ABC transporter permease [Jatrophihabitantaceae bacterium]
MTVGTATATTPDTDDVAANRRPPPKRRQIPWSWRKATPYLLLIPAVVLELLIHIVPMAIGVWISFIRLTQEYIQHWSSAPTAGFDNYRIALKFSGPVGKSLLHSFEVTCSYTVLVVAFSWGIGLVAAWVLQRPFLGRGPVRTLFLIPYALPIFAGVIIWNFMLQRDSGVVNQLLVNDLHLLNHKPFWLIGNNAFFSTAVVAIWRQWPFAFLMIMAGMQSIPNDVYEASAIDGAGSWSQFFRITLPMLRPVNTVLLLMLFLWTFNDFNTPFVLYSMSVPPSTDLMSIHIYTNSFQVWNFGYGSAMSVLMLLFLLLVTAIYLPIANRRSRHVVL